MHAEANGFYWLEGWIGGLGSDYHGSSRKDGKSQEECLEIFTEHLRISPETALEVRRVVEIGYQKGYCTVVASGEVSIMARKLANREGLAKAKADFAQFVNTQRARWALEAKAGLELINSLAA